MDQRENFLFPIFLKLEQLNLLIVGGGNIALEKITAVIKNSPKTNVTLVAPEVLKEITDLALNYPNIKIIQRPFTQQDLADRDLLIVATGDKALSAEIKNEAKKRKILCNVADTPDLCDFYLGSIVKKGDLKIAISTNGKSPTLAKRMRELLEESLPDTIQQLMDNLQAIRNKLSGDFSHKVKVLNELTSELLKKTE